MPTPEQEQAVDVMWEIVPNTVNKTVVRRHLPLLLQSLTPDEIPAHLATARNKAHGALNTALLISGDIGILMVTNRRLLWLGGIRAHKPRVIDVSAENVSGANGTPGGPMSSKLTLTTTKKSIGFYDIQPKEEGQAIAQTLKSREGGSFAVEPLRPCAPAGPENKPTSTTSSRESPQGTGDGTDVFEHVKKLGELHASGVLNDQEFEEKKGQLLARL